MLQILDKKNYAEAYIILKKLNLFKYLPEDVQNVIIQEKDSEHKIVLDDTIPLQFQIKNMKTVELLAYIYIKYFEQNEYEKAYLTKKLNANEEKYQKELQGKYNTENIFKTKEKIIKEENVKIENSKQELHEVIEYKESILKKVLNKILSFFHKK